MGEYATQRNSGTFYTSVLKTREPESLKLDGCGEFGAELDGCGRFVGRAGQMRRGFGHLGGENRVHLMVPVWAGWVPAQIQNLNLNSKNEKILKKF